MGYFADVLIESAEPTWRGIFSETEYIYGLELMAVVAAVFNLMGFIRGMLSFALPTPILRTP